MMGKWYAGLNPQLYTIISLNYSLFLMVFVKKSQLIEIRKFMGIKKQVQTVNKPLFFLILSYNDFKLKI